MVKTYLIGMPMNCQTTSWLQGLGGAMGIGVHPLILRVAILG
jgi:hypothetical protein